MFAWLLKTVLLLSFGNHLSSYCVPHTLLSTEDSAAKETDKRPAARELAGCRDDKQVNGGKYTKVRSLRQRMKTGWVDRWCLWVRRSLGRGGTRPGPEG